MKQRNKAYNFEQPIRILSVKSHGADITFYMVVFSALCAGVLFTLCMKGGKLGIYLELWRVLLSMVLIILASFAIQPLKELREYVPRLSKKPVWTLAELTKMTGKGEKETIQIMTRVLESAFIVDPSCEKAG